MRPNLTLLQKAASIFLMLAVALTALTSPTLAGTTYSPVFLKTWGQSGFEAGQFTGPYGIAVSPSGWVYVADTDNHRIQVFDADGVFQAEFGTYGTEDGAFKSPRGLDFDAAGTLYVADSVNDRVQKFTVDEAGKTFTFAGKFGSTGAGAGQFAQPYDVAVNSASSKVYVADTYNHRVQVFSTAGVHQATLGTGRGAGLTQLHYPSAVAVDSLGNIYVADTTNHRVVKYTSGGTALAAYGASGTGDGQFSGPRGVDINTQGDIIVADTGNHRIQKLASDGSFLAKWGAAGSGNGQFNNPASLAHLRGANNEDSLYVLDRGNDRVQQFEPNAAPTAISLTSASVPEDQAAGYTVGQFVTTDANTGDRFTYAFVTGEGDTHNALFSITGSTLKTAAVFDYETTPALSIRVQATDSGGRSYASALAITVTNANEGPVLNDVTLPPVSEGAPLDFVAGQLAAIDGDPGDVLTYSELGGTGADAFNVQPDGKIVVSDPTKLDYEKKPVVTLNVQVTDSSSNSDTAVVTIFMADANDAPVMNIVQFTIAENSPDKALVGTVTATDEDKPVQTLTYTLLPEGNFGATFIITPDGRILVDRAGYVNFERFPVFDLNVAVTDNGLPNRTTVGVIRVILTDVNEKVRIDDQSVTIPEHSPAGTLTDLMEVTDPEKAVLTWTVLSCEEHPGLVSALNVGTNADGDVTGRLKLEQPMPDKYYEAAYPDISFTAVVKVSDGEFEDTAVVTVRVTNINEPPDIQDGIEATVSEDAVSGFEFGTLLATDPDREENLSFSVIGEPNDTFRASDRNNVGFLYVNAPRYLNYEKQNTYYLTVRVADSGNPDPRMYDSTTVVVHVTNANDAPVFKDVNYSVVIGEQIGKVVGTFAATDEDNDPITYSFVSGNESGIFSINGSGQLVLENPSLLVEGASIKMYVRATDSGYKFDDAQVTVRVGNGNFPPILNGSDIIIKENLANGSLVINAGATDPDGDKLTYSIIGGSGQGAFAIHPSNGSITVIDSTQLNYEYMSELSLQVRVDDDGVPASYAEAYFIITLEDVNEVPVFDDQIVDLPENSMVNFIAYLPNAQDVDANTLFTYEILSGNEAGVFALDEYGAVRVADPTLLDFEASPPPFVLTMRATDNGVPALSDTAVITLNVVGVNELPSITGGTYALYENTPAGTVIDTFTGTDEDLPVQTLSYMILAGNTGGAFKIDPQTGELSVNTPAALDYETNPTFNLTIRVTDSGEGPGTAGAQVEITLMDIDEAPVVGPNRIFNVESKSEAGTVVGVIDAADPEGTALTYQITDGNSGSAFAINEQGVITVAQPSILNPDTFPTFTLTVLVSDASEPAKTTEITVTINVVRSEFPLFLPITVR